MSKESRGDKTIHCLLRKTCRTCCEVLVHREPDKAAGPIGRTNARAVDERASSIVAVGAPVIMVPSLTVLELFALLCMVCLACCFRPAQSTCSCRGGG